MSPRAGYSGTPLAKKLGLRPGDRVRVQGCPLDYAQLVAPVPEGVTLSPRLRRDVDLWHVFATREATLRGALVAAMQGIRVDGMVWVSWPKKTSGVASEITEDTVRAVALPMGLVDVKVCAVDDTWSGLKLVIRKERRAGIAAERA